MALLERMGARPTGEDPVLTRVDLFKNGNVPTLDGVRDAISADKQPKVGATVKPGTAVGLRLDIPPFERTLTKPIRKDGKPTFVVGPSSRSGTVPLPAAPAPRSATYRRSASQGRCGSC